MVMYTLESHPLLFVVDNIEIGEILIIIIIHSDFLQIVTNRSKIKKQTIQQLRMTFLLCIIC